jgi:hypothetical protein
MSVRLGKHSRRFLTKEIVDRIRKLRNKTAAGPDGFQKRHLQIPGLPIILVKIFNILIHCSGFPNVWKINRTTLIPKANKDLTKVKNWRPITIGLILGRIFSSTIDTRLRRAITHNLRRRWFTTQNGCKQNTEVFNTALKTSKIYGGGVFTIVDIAKAFDTIPHSTIGPCLRKIGISTPIVELINNMYEGCRTTIRTGFNAGVEVDIKREIK